MQHRLLLCLTMTAFLFCSNSLFSQETQPKSTRQSSLDAFSRGEYDLAYQGFSELLTKYPKDPFYKYYSGVCLVKLNREPDKALTLLNQVHQGTAMVSNIPSDVLFWLGRAQQMSGWFTEAVDSYNAFTDLAGKKAARELGVDGFIQQCREGKGQITEAQVISDGKKKVNPIAEAEEKKNSGNIDENIRIVKQDLPDDYNIILSEALGYQIIADSLYRIADEQKRSLEKLNYTEKTRMKGMITDNENLAASYQKKADQKYAEVQKKMSGQVSEDEEFTVQELPPANDAATKTIQHDPVTSPGVKPGSNKESLPVEPGIVQQKKVVENTGNSTSKESAVVHGGKDEGPQEIPVTEEVYTVFEVIEKPVYKPGEKIPINPKVPPGLIYRIQVAVFRNPVAPSHFKGITPVYGFKAAGKDMTTYYAGMFRRIADANKALPKVRQKGFKDAFVIALSGGKAVSSDRASILEKEWGKKPFTTRIKSGQKEPADTVPPTLSFRVEVMRSAKPVKPEVVEGMKKIAGTRGLDTEPAGEKTTIYLIGRFITYESAAEYSDLLIRNGYREAKVVAWLGKKEIPVETARQLFEKTE